MVRGLLSPDDPVTARSAFILEWQQCQAPIAGSNLAPTSQDRSRKGQLGDATWQEASKARHEVSQSVAKLPSVVVKDCKRLERLSSPRRKCIRLILGHHSLALAPDGCAQARRVLQPHPPSPPRAFAAVRKLSREHQRQDGKATRPTNSPQRGAPPSLLLGPKSSSHDLPRSDCSNLHRRHPILHLPALQEHRRSPLSNPDLHRLPGR